MEDEFQEIAHCGGKQYVTIGADENGKRGLSFGILGQSPGQARWFGVYVLPLGIPVGTIQMGE